MLRFKKAEADHRGAGRADSKHNLNTRSLLSFPHNSLLAAKPVSQQNSKENSRGQFELMWARPKKKPIEDFSRADIGRV